MTNPRRTIGAGVLLAAGVITLALLPSAPLGATTTKAPEAAAANAWRTDRAWYAGKAEWALYDAVRPIYGVDRAYEATIFTNKQQMDTATTTKAAGDAASGTVEVFKHNLSEIIPTENYAYRFLTTAFVRTDTLEPYKVVFSSQEDCGATYKQFVVRDRAVEAEQFCYFPDAGSPSTVIQREDDLAFHDTLSLTLRDYPFDAERKPTLSLRLVPDQTDTHETARRPADARVEYVQRESLALPFGIVDAHHLRVTHERDGGATRSDFWFAADADEMRHVMVKYAGPYGVRYELKKLAWWAYWDRSRPAPR